MKSAFVTASVSRDAGGLFFAMTSLGRSLHRLGVDLSVHGVIDGHTQEDASAWDPVMLSAHPRSGPAALAYAPQLGSALRAGGYDILHTHGIWLWASAAVHRWQQKTGRPYVISPHGMLDPWAVAQSRWKKRIVSALYESAHLRDAACIHALCQSEADAIRAYGLKNPVCVIPNGVDLPVETDQGSGGRRQASGRKILLFLGRLHPKKGLVNALRAWAELVTKHKAQSTTNEWQFAIAGWDQGGHEAELKQLCDDLGLAYAEQTASHFLNLTPDHRPLPPVLFLGPVFGEAKEQLLRSASAFILPSFSEGLPMAVLEAMAYRLPVLMTDACNLPEGFAADAAIRIGTEVGGEGEIGRSGEGERGRGGEGAMGIAQGLRMLMEMSDSEREAMGAHGRALVESQFTWPQVAAQMKEVYEWVLGGGPRPACVRD